jgi:hypothetical protein
VSQGPLRRCALIGLLASLLIVASTAGCVRSPSLHADRADATAAPLAGPLARYVVTQVLRKRTATVKVGLQVGGSGGRADLSGPVEYTANGVDADLTGTILGNAVHVIVLGDTVYVSQLLQLPAGTTWLKMAAGGARAPDSLYWVVIDEIVTGLSYVTDETVMDGLVYNAAPPENIDGIAVHTAVANATRSEMLAKLKPPQLSRYQSLWKDFTGARIIVGVGDDAIPRRLSVTPVGTVFYPTIELDYTQWAATTAAIAAPSGPDVREYP